METPRRVYDESNHCVRVYYGGIVVSRRRAPGESVEDAGRALVDAVRQLSTWAERVEAGWRGELN